MKRRQCLGGKWQVAREILTYLAENPEAQDTLEGVVRWWLLEQEINREVKRIEEALQDLVSKGLVLERRGSDSLTHYRINMQRYEEILQLIKEAPESSPDSETGT